MALGMVGRCITYFVRVVVLQLVVLAATASASPIVLEMDTRGVSRRPVDGFFEFDFSFGHELDGKILSGQSLSLDFVFARNLLAHVEGVEGDLDFDVLLVLQTNATGFPGFFGSDATGFLLGANGTPLQAPLDPEWVGRSMGSDGSLAVGLFPRLSAFAMTGAHYDITLPSSGHAITGGLIRLASNSPEARIRFGKKFEKATPVPEPSVLLLLGTGFALLSTGRRFMQGQ